MLLVRERADEVRVEYLEQSGDRLADVAEPCGPPPRMSATMTCLRATDAPSLCWRKNGPAVAAAKWTLLLPRPTKRRAWWLAAAISGESRPRCRPAGAVATG